MRAWAKVAGPFVVAGLLWNPVAAQDRAGVAEPSGVRDSPRSLDDVLIAKRAARGARGVPAPVWLVLPSFVSADGLRIGGGTFGVVKPISSIQKVQLRAGYKRIHLTDGSEHNQVSVDAKDTLLIAEVNRVAVLGEFKKTVDSSQKYKVGIAYERTVANKLTLGGGVDYLTAKLDGSDSTGDVAPVIGASYSWTDHFETSVDYAFENDVDGASDYSFTVTSLIAGENGHRGDTLLVFGAGKGRTVFGTVVIPFR